MTTFQELQKQSEDAKNRLEVLLHIIDYLDTTFKSSGPSQKVLVREDKVKVPESAFESVIEDLVSEIKAIKDSVTKINESEVSVDQPKPKKEKKL